MGAEIDALRPGTIFRNYRVESVIGRGGMGTVFRAYDTTLHRTVALKIVDTTADREPACLRLLREARSAAALNHPNICTIHEVGEVQDVAFIVMEYVEGRSLHAHLEEHGGLPPTEAVGYALQAADALGYAHAHGVVHRDSKAANVLVTGDGRLKIVDFGLARRLDAPMENATTIASVAPAGAVAGTPYAMAPEQVRGETTDERTDIWALGILLYEMVTGVRPFVAPTLSELFSAILRDAPRPGPASVAVGLRTVIERCLEKDPAQRYQHAADVRSALESITSASQKVPPLPATVVSRRRWVWSVACGLVLVTAAVGIAILLQSRSTGPPASKIPEANEYLRMAEFALSSGQGAPRMRELLSRALELDPTFAQARVMLALGYWLEIDGGLSNDTNLLYKAEAELRRALQDHPKSARAHSILAFVYYYQGRKELIPHEVETAIGLDPGERRAHLIMAIYHQLNGDYAQSQALLQKLMTDDPLFMPARANFAENLRLSGDFEGALREQKKVQEQDPNNPFFVPGLAPAYWSVGDLASARRTLEFGRKLEPRSYFFRLLWALQLAQEGKREEALRELDADVLKYAELVYIGLFGAECFAVLGDTSKALDWLDREVRAGDERVEWFARDPLLANIRAEPRFRQIVDSVQSRRQLAPGRR